MRKQSLYLLLGKPIHFVKDFSRQHRSLLPVHLSRFSPKNFRTGQAGIAEKAQLGKIKNLRPLNHERTEPIHTDRMNWFFSKPPSASQVICSESGAVICASVFLLSRTWMRPLGRQGAGHKLTIQCPFSYVHPSLWSGTWPRKPHRGFRPSGGRPDCGPQPARLAGDGSHHLYRFLFGDISSEGVGVIIVIHQHHQAAVLLAQGDKSAPGADLGLGHHRVMAVQHYR